jgi:tetratricopeptide (TPR) repeat protein
MPAVLIFILLFFQGADDALRRGKAYAGEGRWREAEEQLRLHLNRHPKTAEAVVLHARALAALGQPFDAALELEEFLKQEPESVPALKLYGHLLDAVVEEKAKAEEVMLKTARLAPRDPEVWRSLGNLYLVRNRFDDAIRCFAEAARLRPTDPLLVASLAYARGKVAPSPQVAASFLKAVGLNRRSGQPDPAVHLLYGDYLLATQKTSEGIAQLTRALLLNPHLAEAYFLRALAYERLKDYRRAEADALAAIREEEGRRDARQLLLRVYRALGDSAKAEREAAALQQLSEQGSREQEAGRDVRGLLATAEPLLREGKFAAAAQAYEEIVKTAPDFYEAYFALGMSYFQLGRLPESEAAFKKYLSFQPISADGHAALGVLLLQRGRFAEARGEFKRAIEIDPGAVEARKGFAQSALMTGEAAAAARELDPLYQQGAGCDPECFTLLARAEFALNRPERVVEILNRGLKLHEGSAEYLRSLTQLLLDERPRGPQTRQYVAILKERMPAEAETYYFSGLLEYLNSRPGEAATEARKGLALAVDDAARARLQGLVGRAEEKLGNYGGAEAAFKEARELGRRMNPPDAQAGAFYAQFLARRSREEEALGLLDQIIAESPNAGVAYLERAKVLAARRSRERAIEDAKQALAHAGIDLETTRAAHGLLIRMYYSLGKRDEALAHQRQLETLR